MNSDLACVHDWPLANKPSLNVIKTELMLTGSTQKLNNLVVHPSHEINHVKIDQV